jgi:hypothetical protein
MTQGSSRKLGAALIVIGAILLLSGRNAPRSQNEFVAEAAIQVSKPEGQDLSDALRTESMILESTALLDGVISNLNLTVKWTEANAEVSLPRIRHRLASVLRVRENEEQIRIRVSGPDKPETEELANSVLRVYQDLRRSHLRQSKPSDIVKLEEQLDDLEPRLKQAIETMERVGKELTITEYYQPPKNEPTLLDRIREGKEEEQPDNTSSFYNSDPVPKDETPEHAKRRIYLRSRRVADALSLRKERFEARLAILRARSSTPESASVQVVQAPEAARQRSHVSRMRNSAWSFATSFAGWGAIIGGAILLLRLGMSARNETTG